MSKISTPSPNQDQIKQHSLLKPVVLHFLPAVIWIIFYIPLARIASEKGFPTMLVMLITGVFTLFSFQMGYLYYQGKKKNGRLSLQGVVLYREKMPWWQYFLFVVPIVAWITLVFAFGMDFVGFFRTKVFFWIPDWYYLNMGSVEQNTAAVEIVMAVLSLLVFGIIGPISEELYFRGYLLPRLAKLGKWAPLLNVVLFNLYHFWQLHLAVISIIALLPWIYIVWWKRNVYLSISVHCFINLVGNTIRIIDRFN